MKLSTIVAFLLIAHSSFLYASSIDIDAQIEKIRQAPQSQRYQLVNELKQQIAQMNANQQARAIAKYQEETLNAQQSIDSSKITIDESNIANQANQEVIKNQLQQEQEHQIVIPPVEHMDDSVEKIIPEQKQQNPTIQQPQNSPNETMPVDNVQENIEDHNPDFTDVNDNPAKDVTDNIKEQIQNPIEQNPVKDVTDKIEEQIQNPIEDVTDNVREQIQNPIKDVTDDAREQIQNPIKDVTDNIQREMPQPEVIENRPKPSNPVNQQESKPTFQKPSFPTTSPIRRH